MAKEIPAPTSRPIMQADQGTHTARLRLVVGRRLLREVAREVAAAAADAARLEREQRGERIGPVLDDVDLVDGSVDPHLERLAPGRGARRPCPRPARSSDLAVEVVDLALDLLGRLELRVDLQLPALRGLIGEDGLERVRRRCRR